MANLLIDAIRMSASSARHEHITHVFGPTFGVKARFDAVSDIFHNRNSYYTQSNLLGGQTPVGRVAAKHRSDLARDQDEPIV